MADVVIIGGGPAGSAMGSYLSQAGISNVILERAHHPRQHVGESLVPSTTRIFEDIGFLETMEREGFVKKYGAAWHPPKKAASLFIKFREFPQEGVEQEYTYHVDRAKFDWLLLKHAESLGSEVIEGVHVKQVLFDDAGKACGVRFVLGGQTVDLPCKAVVDASGRHCLLGRQLGLKQSDALFNQYAVHGWYENVWRGEEEVSEDIHIHFLPVQRGWVWQIPITETVTSIGVVAEKDVFKKANKDHDAWFHDLIQSAPDIQRAMADARQVRPLSVEADYSYAMDRFVGDGWALVGDAARFVDPIFSSGVSVALYSAKFASEVLIEGLANDDVSEARLRPYEDRLRAGTKIWYEFIKLYYKMLPLFTRFIQHPEYRHQVLSLLQGDVYDREEAPVLDAMRQFIAAVEKTEGHLFEPYLDPEIPLELPRVPAK